MYSIDIILKLHTSIININQEINAIDSHFHIFVPKTVCFFVLRLFPPLTRNHFESSIPSN